MLQDLIVALAMVGEQSAEQGAAPPINACALLTDDEVASVLGKPVSPGERHDSGIIRSGDYVSAGTYSSTCLWRVVGAGSSSSDPNLSLGGSSYAILNAMQWPGVGQATNFLQSFRDSAKQGLIDQSPVALKIADQALWWGDGVAACKGNRSFGISVHLVGGRDRERGMEESLAKTIATRL